MPKSGTLPRRGGRPVLWRTLPGGIQLWEMDGCDVGGRGLAPGADDPPSGTDSAPDPIRSKTTPAPPQRGLGATRPLRRLVVAPAEDSYLVDSASSHMLVSKIKPCKSKYKQLYGETANGSLNQLSFI